LAEFIIAKHRNGSVEDVKMRFIKEQAKFTNWDQINTGMYQPSMDQYEDMASAPFQSSSVSSLQGATGNEFDISRVSTPMPSSGEDVPF
jgi:replicative DNA helicase